MRLVRNQDAADLKNIKCILECIPSIEIEPATFNEIYVTCKSFKYKLILIWRNYDIDRFESKHPIGSLYKYQNLQNNNAYLSLMLRSLGETFFVSSSYYILKRKSYSSFHLKIGRVKYFTSKKGFVAQIIHSRYAFQMI